MKKITVLGSTGSIGTQTLDLIGRNPEEFTVACLTAGRNIDLFRSQLTRFNPRYAVVANSSDALQLSKEFPGIGFGY